MAEEDVEPLVCNTGNSTITLLSGPPKKSNEIWTYLLNGGRHDLEVSQNVASDTPVSKALTWSPM